jgi:hypothetical protein
MSILDVVVSGVITGLTVSITIAASLKILLNYVRNLKVLDVLTEKNLESLLQLLVNNEKYQKFLFESGAIAGNGAIQGSGLQKLVGSGGQPKGIIGQLMPLVSQFLLKKNPGDVVQQATQAVTDKW